MENAPPIGSGPTASIETDLSGDMLRTAARLARAAGLPVGANDTPTWLAILTVLAIAESENLILHRPTPAASSRWPIASNRQYGIAAR